MSIFHGFEARARGTLVALAAGAMILAGCTDDEDPVPKGDAGPPVVADAPTAASALNDAGATDKSPSTTDGMGAEASSDGGLATLEPMPCGFELPSAMWKAPRCGQVRVPEDRARPDGRQVTLAVAVFSLARPGARQP